MKIKNYTPIKYNDSRGANNIHFEDIDEGICYKSSFSKKNVFRGLHIQIPPEPQEKYISVSKGKVLDFVLCLNSQSNDFGEIKSFTITPEKGFYKIPKYCAHGYLAEVDSVFDYICVGKYAETNEITIVMEDDFYLDKIISKKDKKGMGIDEALIFFKNINWE